ncbi:MAG: hypothetical protein ACHREM_04620 [Polyangiales bacterium]
MSATTDRLANARRLGPEMIAERWEIIGGDSIMWMHPPSKRVIAVHECLWSQCVGVPAVPSAPATPDADGYAVSCTVHDDLGNPTEEGANFWIESYGFAVRYARAIRRAILGDAPIPKPTQLDLFGDEP